MSDDQWPGRIELHGWDLREEAWHGPDEMSFSLAGARRFLAGMRASQGFWHGKFTMNEFGAPPVSFNVQLRDLGDAGLATLDIDGSPGGPVEIILVAPASRRGKLRQDMAFEFASYVRFMEGPVNRGWESAIHDRVERVLNEAGAETTTILSVEMRFITPEVHLVVAEAAGRLAMSLAAWMAEADAQRPGAERG